MSFYTPPKLGTSNSTPTLFVSSHTEVHSSHDIHGGVLKSKHTFLTHYLDFIRSKGKTLSKVPVMGYKELDLYRLYQEVIHYGGFQKVRLLPVTTPLSYYLFLEPSSKAGSGGSLGTHPHFPRSAYETLASSPSHGKSECILISRL